MPWVKKVMDNLTVQKIREILAKNDKIGIAVGKNPGIDEMGAALALYLALSNSGKSVNIACPTEPIVEISSLVGIDKVKTGFDSNTSDLIVSFPDRGDIKKISYSREDGMLNIIVKAGDEGLTFDARDIKFRKGGEAQSLLFTVGVPRVSDLGKVFDAENLKGTTIINIDNKAENQGYGDIALVSKKFSSVSEQVASLLFALDLNMDQDAAQNLLLGIVAFSDNFQNENTTPLAFETVANLMKKGAARPSKLSNQRADVAEDLSSFFAPKKPKEEKTKVETLREEDKEEDKKDENPPDDWLAPKIYKGSTSI